MARVPITDVAEPPASWVDDGSTAPTIRWGALAARPELLEAMERYGAVLRADSALPERHRAIALLAVTRRSEYEAALQRERSRALGLGDDLFEAVDDENWTSDCFDESERAVFRFALMFDSGHGIGESVVEELRRHLDDAQIVELCLQCAHVGGLARLSIALGLDHSVGGLS